MLDVILGIDSSITFSRSYFFTMLQIAAYHERSVIPSKPIKRPPLKFQRQKLLSFLQENYEPVNAKWTTERCAVCRWVEDWDYNKIILCNRCQIAVHQECYGAQNLRDFTSWACYFLCCEESTQESDASVQSPWAQMSLHYVY